MPVGLLAALVAWALRIDARGDAADAVAPARAAPAALAVTPSLVQREVGVAASLGRFLRDALRAYEGGAPTDCPELAGAPATLAFSSVNEPNAAAATLGLLDRFAAEVQG